MKIRILAVIALCLVAVGASLTLVMETPEVEAQAGGSVEHIILANSSTSSTRVRHISLGDYPTNIAHANYPQRVDETLGSLFRGPGVAESECSELGGYKTFPTMPSYGTLFDHNFLDGDPYPYPRENEVADRLMVVRGGNHFSFPGGCMNWVFDGGTSTYGSYTLGGKPYSLPAAGAWIYPTAFGGWALPNYNDSGYSWRQAVRITAGKIGEGFCYNRDDWRASCTPNYPIWSQSQHYTNNYFSSISGRWPSTIRWPRQSRPTTGNNAPFVTTQGTILARTAFDLSQDDYNRISHSESGAMLFVDIIADDFFNVFINGVPVTGTDYTVTGRHVRIADSNQNSSVRIADLLVPGKNVIAVQAVDKTLIYPAGKIGDSAWFGRSFGRGLWYNLRVRINSGFTVPATSANVIPEVSSSQSLVVPGGESPVFDFSVSNEGPSTPSSDVTYTITFRNSPPGEAGGSVTPSLTSGCTLSGNLSSLAADTGGFISLPGCATATITGGVPSTGQLCAVLTIANANPEDVPPSPRTAHRCLPIGELPVVQVSGGDLVVRSALSAAEDTSRIIRTAYIPSSGIGGWAEYGVFGPSSVDMHSGGSLANRSSAPSADQKNSLVFANGGSGLSNPGSFKVSGSKPAINYRGIGFSAGSNGTCSAGRIDQMAVSGVVTNCSNSGILSIQASAISPGSSYAIRAPNATVHITGNITYGNGSHSNLSDLSQVVIEAANIVIAANTERVDAILYASETINTCGATINYTSSTPYFHDLTSSSCDRPLVINGHIQAQRLFLRRTHSDNSTVLPRNRTPAELINGRSDVYLWLYGQSASTGVVSTGSVRELPPRL